MRHEIEKVASLVSLQAEADNARRIAALEAEVKRLRAIVETLAETLPAIKVIHSEHLTQLDGLFTRCMRNVQRTVEGLRQAHEAEADVLPPPVRRLDG